MPTTHTVTSYKFDELSDKAKEKARDWYREGALDYEWWEHTYEDAANIGLKITEFDLGRSHDIEGKFTLPPVQVARAIVKDHGEGTETRKLADAFLSTDVQTAAWLCHACGCDNERERTECRDCEEEATGTEDREWASAEEVNEAFLHDLCQQYWDILNTEMEFLLSDECVDESITSNDYDFDANGNRFRY